jgi:hypothetical protein
MRAKARIFVSEDRGWWLGRGYRLSGVMTDVVHKLVRELIDPPENLKVVGPNDLFNLALPAFQAVHPDFQPAYIALDLNHVALQLGNVSLQLGNIGFYHDDIGVHPLDRREYQVALVHATAPAIVMSLYAIHQSDAIKE